MFYIPQLSTEKMKASLKEEKKPSKNKESKKVTDSKPSTSSKSKSPAEAAKTEHSYAENPPIKKVKVSEEFPIEQQFKCRIIVD